jgi:hypothetical protein
MELTFRRRGGYVGGRTEEDAETLARLRQHVRTGRPLGAPALPDRLESLLGRMLRPKKPGPKPQGGKRCIPSPELLKGNRHDASRDS